MGEKEKKKIEKPFAAVSKSIAEDFLKGAAGFSENLRMNMADISEPHYDDKALTLFLLIRFRADCAFRFYTNENMLCEMMGLSLRGENRTAVMANIFKMQEDGFIYIHQKPGSKFFEIKLDYNMFMPENEFVIIYRDEFDNLINDTSRDKLILLLYFIKMFQYGDSGVSFPSIENLIMLSHMSRQTISNGMKKLDDVLHTYKARINFNDGTHKDVNYYRSKFDSGAISKAQIESIVQRYYVNIKSITERI